MDESELNTRLPFASAKLDVLQEISEVSKTNPKLNISGSISQTISARNIKKDIVTIRAEDLMRVSDINIATIGFAK